MEGMELVKNEPGSASNTSAAIDLLLQVPQQADDTICADMTSDLAVPSTESQHLIESPECSLSESISEHHIEHDMDISENGVVQNAGAVSMQDINSLTGVDIITLQPSQLQPMFQLMTSGEGGSYMQLTDNQLLQSVTRGDQRLQTVTLPNGVTALVTEPNEQESQAIQLEDDSGNIESSSKEFRNSIQDPSIATKLLAGQVIQLEDGTTGFIQAGLSGSSDVQSVQLEDGSTAYISLFGEPGGGTLSIDHNPPQELQSPLKVIADKEEEESHHHNQSMDDEHLATITNIKQENSHHEASPSPGSLQHSGVVMSETEQNTGQPHVSYRALQLGDKAYRCTHEDCGRLYTTQHHLKVHSRSHTGDKPFNCEFPGCGKAFATGYGLKSHTRVHTGEKPYRCTETTCTKAFKTSGDLQKHIRTHTGEKPFKCPFEGCDRMFTTSNIRKVHIRTHTGERPYICEEEGCNKSFASATNYKNHIRIHTGEKPYVCTVEGCGKRFTEYSSLYKHHVVHTQSKPYVCNHCHKTYRQTSTLSMHKRTIHNEHDPSLDGDALLNTIAGVQIVNAVGNNDCDCDTEGALVINTADNTLINTSGTMTQALPTLQPIAHGSSQLLQHLQPAGISVQGAGLDIQHVYLIADPSQLETLKHLAAQQAGGDQTTREDENSESTSVSLSMTTASAPSHEDSIIEGSGNVLTIHTGAPDDQNLVAYQAD